MFGRVAAPQREHGVETDPVEKRRPTLDGPAGEKAVVAPKGPPSFRSRSPRRSLRYIMPPMPPMSGAGGHGFRLVFLDLGDEGLRGQHQAGDSDAAFCSAVVVTLAGSMTPAAIRSSISPLAAL